VAGGNGETGWAVKGMTQPRGGGWFVYILGCADGSLYTGITTDVSRRCRQHNVGTASRYTRSRRPTRLVYRETHLDRSRS
jgi:putative endonuclease